MLTWFLIGLVLLFFTLGGLSWLSKADPKDIVRNLKWVALCLVAAVLIGVAATKNLQYLWGLSLAALPWVGRALRAWSLWQRIKGPSKGQRSSISTPFMDMTLDHDTGEMDGRILKGPFQGALLSELSLEEGIELLSQMREAGDQRSQSLMEAYLDRVHGAAWRGSAGDNDGRREDHSQGQDKPRGSAMTRDEALQLLGLKEGASSEEIEAAYKRLMKQVHPDAGGSDYLASQVNAARDILL